MNKLSYIGLYRNFSRVSHWRKQENRDKLDIEKDKEIIKGINSSIILNSACLVEGALNFILKYLISSFGMHNYAGQVLTEFDVKLRNELKTRILKATWIDYQNLFKLIVGIELKNITSVDWEGINYLFTFRNILAHGESIDIDYSVTQNDEDSIEIFETKIMTKENLVNFLIKKKFIPKPNANNRFQWEFLSNNISNYFYDLAKNFLFELSEKLPHQDSKQYIEEWIKSKIK